MTECKVKVKVVLDEEYPHFIVERVNEQNVIENVYTTLISENMEPLLKKHKMIILISSYHESINVELSVLKKLNILCDIKENIIVCTFSKPSLEHLINFIASTTALPKELRESTEILISKEWISSLCEIEELVEG
jgi:hypothetical protein